MSTAIVLKLVGLQSHQHYFITIISIGDRATGRGQFGRLYSLFWLLPFSSFSYSVRPPVGWAALVPDGS